MNTEEATYEFTVWQDDDEVATGCCADRDTAIREAIHYGAQYRQDGPVSITVFERKERLIWAQRDHDYEDVELPA